MRRESGVLHHPRVGGATGCGAAGGGWRSRAARRGLRLTLRLRAGGGGGGILASIWLCGRAGAVATLALGVALWSPVALDPGAPATPTDPPPGLFAAVIGATALALPCTSVVIVEALHEECSFVRFKNSVAGII